MDSQYEDSVFIDFLWNTLYKFYAEIGVKKIRLLTNNPKKIKGLTGYGLEITEHVPNVCGVQKENRKYLETKQNKMGHTIFTSDKKN